MARPSLVSGDGAVHPRFNAPVEAPVPDEHLGCGVGGDLCAVGGRGSLAEPGVASANRSWCSRAAGILRLPFRVPRSRDAISCISAARAVTRILGFPPVTRTVPGFAAARLWVGGPFPRSAAADAAGHRYGYGAL